MSSVGLLRERKAFARDDLLDPVELLESELATALSGERNGKALPRKRVDRLVTLPRNSADMPFVRNLDQFDDRSG